MLLAEIVLNVLVTAFFLGLVGWCVLLLGKGKTWWRRR